MKNIIIKKVNGEIELINIDYEALDTKKFSKDCHTNYNHLCTNCDNCYADECIKVFDEVKKPIGKYDFISDGVQVYDNNGVMQFFYVLACDGYKEDEKRKKATTKEEIAELNRLKESIKMLYFDAETIEEADQTHLDLLRRKQLVFIKRDEKNKTK